MGLHIAYNCWGSGQFVRKRRVRTAMQQKLVINSALDLSMCIENLACLLGMCACILKHTTPKQPTDFVLIKKNGTLTACSLPRHPLDMLISQAMSPAPELLDVVARGSTASLAERVSNAGEWCLCVTSFHVLSRVHSTAFVRRMRCTRLLDAATPLAALRCGHALGDGLQSLLVQSAPRALSTFAPL